MRLLLIAVISISINNSTVRACDVCGGSGAFYNGMLPLYYKHFVGFRYRFSSFRSDLGHQSAVSEYSQEYYHSFELTGRFFLHRKVQLLAFLPVNYHQQFSSNESVSIAGQGDLSVMALYDLYNSSLINEKPLKHKLLLGGGVKLPTGPFQKRNQDGELLNPAFQIGTGSFDFIINSVYTLRYKSIGLNVNAAYKINLPDKNDYKFGNQFSATTTFFVLYKSKKSEDGLLSKFGLSFENANYNLKGGYKRVSTGGNILFASAGFDIYYKKINIGINFQYPVYQLVSEGLVSAGLQSTININYLF
jgi:hypothetical protein